MRPEEPCGAPAARLLIGVILAGLLACGSAELFARAINLAFHHGIERLATLPLPWFLAASLLVVLSTSALSGWLMFKFCPQAAGSGIPQVKRAYLQEDGGIPFRVVWVKFVAGVLSIGGGASLGREGPTVQIAAGLASCLARHVPALRLPQSIALAAGSAAGLAAAFKAPLSAGMFFLEEIAGELKSPRVWAALLGALTASVLLRETLGQLAEIELAPLRSPTGWTWLWMIPVGTLAAFVGMLFQNSTLSLRASLAGQLPVPRWTLPMLGGAITWTLGVSVFILCGHLGVFGLGYGDLTAALRGELLWGAAAALVLAKLLATIASYGFGGCGGIFSPLLCLGVFTGAAACGPISWIHPLSAHDATALMLVGMGACIGAVLRAPFTSILIVFEMTRELQMLPGLMLAVLAAHLVSRAMARENFYAALLRQDGHPLAD